MKLEVYQMKECSTKNGLVLCCLSGDWSYVGGWAGCDLLSSDEVLMGQRELRSLDSVNSLSKLGTTEEVGTCWSGDEHVWSLKSNMLKCEVMSWNVKGMSLGSSLGRVSMSRCVESDNGDVSESLIHTNIIGHHSTFNYYYKYISYIYTDQVHTDTNQYYFSPHSMHPNSPHTTSTRPHPPLSLSSSTTQIPHPLFPHLLYHTMHSHIQQLLSLINHNLDAEYNDFLSLERCRLVRANKNYMNQLRSSHSNQQQMEIVTQMIWNSRAKEERMGFEDRWVLQGNFRLTENQEYYKGSLEQIMNKVQDVQKLIGYLMEFQGYGRKILSTGEIYKVERHGKILLTEELVERINDRGVKELQLKGQDVEFQEGSAELRIELLKLDIFWSCLESLSTSSHLLGIHHLQSLSLQLETTYDRSVIKEVQNLLSAAISLKHLSLSDPQGHTSEITLPSHIHNQLQTLNLSAPNICTSSSHMTLLQHLKHLPHLNTLSLSLDNNPNFLQEHNYFLAENLHHSNNLRSLSLNLCDTNINPRFVFHLLHSIKNKMIVRLELLLTGVECDGRCLESVVFVVSGMCTLREVRIEMGGGLREEEVTRLQDYVGRCFQNKGHHIVIRS